MMMPQQIQMPPMPAGLSMPNFAPRKLDQIHRSMLKRNLSFFFFIAPPMPGLPPFMMPPAGFPQMAYNGPRF